MHKSMKYRAITSLFLTIFTLIGLQSILINPVSAPPVTKVYVDPASQTVSASFTVDINVKDLSYLYDWGFLYGWEFRLNYSTSILTATGVTEGPFLKTGDDAYLWVGDDNDNLYQLYLADPATTATSWDSGIGRPYGIEYVNGHMYIVSYADDLLYNKTLTGGNGSPASWDISGYSGDAYGLSWIDRMFVSGESVGTGDGIEDTFTLDYAPVVEYSETVYIDFSEVSAYYINYTSGEITFTSPPGVGAFITADYQYYGSWFLIADRGDDRIYFAPFSNPATSVNWIDYYGISTVEGVAFDGEYIWASDPGTDKIYQLNQTELAANQASPITSWDSPDSNPTGIVCDGVNVWVCDAGSDLLYKCSTTGTVRDSYSAPAGGSEGLAFSMSAPASPRSTWFQVKELDDAKGRVWVTATLLGDIIPPVGGGVLATISFDIDAAGTSTLDLHKTKLEGYDYENKKAYRITHLPVDGSVTTTVGVPEFPLGAAAEIAIAGVVIYVWWRRRKTKLYKSPTPHI